MIPDKIERRVLIVDVPEGRSPSRGDIENSFFFMDQATVWQCVSLEKPGTISDNFSKLLYHNGDWKRGCEYIYGPNNDEEKLKQNIDLLRTLGEISLVLRSECDKIREKHPEYLDHYGTIKENKKRINDSEEKVIK
jgi:hypothetical protein